MGTNISRAKYRCSHGPRQAVRLDFMVEGIATARLVLEPITLEHVEAVFRGDREELERITHAKVPESWPGRGLVERAFSASLDAIRADPATRLWGDRLILTKEDDERLVVGSVIFHGRPSDGIAE